MKQDDPFVIDDPGSVEPAPPTTAAPAAGTPVAAITRIGDLVYTRKALYVLFFWLLVIDFSFMLIQDLLPPILQARLKNDLKADSLLYTVFLTTGPSFINFFLNPVISIKSDRHRGPRGRRVPFLMYSTPLVCISLALMGFGNEIAAWIQATLLPSLGLDHVTVWVFGVLHLIYFAANMFIATTFYYLFNDVVPEQHLVRFMSYFRVVGALAHMLYGWFILKYTNKWAPLDIEIGPFSFHDTNFWYPKLILICGAILFAFIFIFALTRIKEPTYPPPPPLAQGDTPLQKMRTTLVTLVGECFSHRVYVLYFVAVMVTWMSYQMGQFTHPMRIDLGMDLAVLGKIAAITGGVTVVMTLLTANYGDRFKPMPMMVFAMILLVATGPIGLLYLIPNLTPNQYLWIHIAYAASHLPVMVILSMADSTLGMSLLPRGRYGQFCAAAAMMRMILPGILGSLLAGWLMRTLEQHQGTYALRYSFAWSWLFQILALVCYWLLYREWKRLGGRKSYAPPEVRPAAVAATSGLQGA
jgi:Na+/melibiose symporter-like transporter